MTKKHSLNGGDNLDCSKRRRTFDETVEAYEQKASELEDKRYHRDYQPIVDLLKNLQLTEGDAMTLLTPVIRSNQFESQECRTLLRWMRRGLDASFSSTEVIANAYVFAKIIWLNKFESLEDPRGNTYDDFMEKADLKRIADFYRSQLPKMRANLNQVKDSKKRINLEKQLRVIESNPQLREEAVNQGVHAKFSVLKQGSSASQGGGLVKDNQPPKQ